MFLILALVPTCLLVLTCVAGKGDMLDIEELRREELRRIRSASGRRPRSSGSGEGDCLASSGTGAVGGKLAGQTSTTIQTPSPSSLRLRPKTGMRS